MNLIMEFLFTKVLPGLFIWIFAGLLFFLVPEISRDFSDTPIKLGTKITSAFKFYDETLIAVIFFSTLFLLGFITITNKVASKLRKYIHVQFLVKERIKNESIFAKFNDEGISQVTGIASILFSSYLYMLIDTSRFGNHVLDFSPKLQSVTFTQILALYVLAFFWFWLTSNTESNIQIKSNDSNEVGQS